MSRAGRKHERSLAEKYPPSEPCSCEICLAYCMRPGWWTVRQASDAFEAGYGRRMMLEISPERALGVLSPAFQGCEGALALQEYANRGCTFLAEKRCELHETVFQPLECRFCHHSRTGLGPMCHADLEQDWRTAAGRWLLARWSRMTGIRQYLLAYGLEKLYR